jgi:Kef-type K+ transport system membrane component KefB
MTHAAVVPQIPSHALLVFLLQVGLLLFVALMLGRLAVALRLPAVVGELSAGLILGPTLFGHLAPGFAGWLLPAQAGQFHLLDAVGQLGVLLLVAVAGMEIDFRLVRRRGATAARVSIGGLVVPLGLGIGLGYLLPASLMAATADRTVFALFLGVAMCVSAIPVIAKTLLDMNLLHRNIGQLTLAAAAVDDIFGWLMLSIVSAMATTGVRAGDLALSLLSLALVVVGAAVIGRPALRATFRIVNRSPDAGPTIAAVFIMVVLGAAGTHAIGLEPVFGAFVVGILIGSSGTVDRAKLDPLCQTVMAVFAPLFFATAGLRMDLTALRRPALLGAAAVVLVIAIAGKFIGVYFGARSSRLSRWEALALGASMNARGVIEVVVATVGLRLGILTTEIYTMVILVAIVTSLMAPPILRSTMRRVEHTAEEQLRQSTRDLPARSLEDNPA